MRFYNLIAGYLSWLGKFKKKNNCRFVVNVQWKLGISVRYMVEHERQPFSACLLCCHFEPYKKKCLMKKNNVVQNQSQPNARILVRKGTLCVKCYRKHV